MGKQLTGKSPHGPGRCKEQCRYKWRWAAARQYREMRGWTRPYVAEKLGTCARSVENWERPRDHPLCRTPSFTHGMMLVNLYGCAPESLIVVDGNPLFMDRTLDLRVPEMPDPTRKRRGRSKHANKPQ